jgi:2',3'-cyclic-nucleotide 2'-phosphodiesterase (5'-nucleotidase family)
VSANKTLVVYHTSDIHDRHGFGRKLAELVEPGALLVDCGDSLRGSSTFYRKNEDIAKEFAVAPYRAQAVGNREFHYLHGCMLARSRAMNVPWVCSNVIDLQGREPAFSRELTVRAGDLAVRILALLVPQYRTGSGWERLFGWRFLSPEAALGELLPRTDAKPDATLLLSHLGLAADRELAKRFPGLSAIVGGHSHDTLEKPEFFGSVPIAHAGPYARYAGRLELAVEHGVTRFVSYRLVPLLETAGTAR